MEQGAPLCRFTTPEGGQVVANEAVANLPAEELERLDGVDRQYKQSQDRYEGWAQAKVKELNERARIRGSVL